MSHSYNKLIILCLLVHFLTWFITSVYGVSAYRLHIDDTIVPLNYTDAVHDARLLECTLAIATYAVFLPNTFCAWIVYFFGIPLSTTYGPLQYIFAGIFIDFTSKITIFENEIQNSLFSSRIFSYIFFCFGLSAVIVLIYKVQTVYNRYLLHCSFAITFLSIILQLRFYSFQSSPYAGTLLSVALLYLSIFYLTMHQSKKALLYSGVLFTVSMSINYSLIYIIPAIICSLLILTVIKELQAKRLLEFACLILVLSPLYILFLIRVIINYPSPSLNWNIGVNSQFLSTTEGGTLSVANVFNALYAFSETFGTLLTPIYASSTVYTYIGALYIIFAIFLSIMAIKFPNRVISRPPKVIMTMAVLILMVIVTMLLLNISGKLPLSPTRHMMGVVYTCAVGTIVIAGYYASKQQLLCATIIVFIIAGFHHVYFSDVLNSRVHKIGEVTQAIKSNCKDCMKIYYTRNSIELLLSSDLKTTYDLEVIEDSFQCEKYDEKFLYYSSERSFESYARRCETVQFKIEDLLVYQSDVQVGLSDSVSNGANVNFLQLIESLD